MSEEGPLNNTRNIEALMKYYSGDQIQLEDQVKSLQQDVAVRDVQIRELKIRIYNLIYGEE